jgi:hypothetical protein
MWDFADFYFVSHFHIYCYVFRNQEFHNFVVLTNQNDQVKEDEMGGA